MEHTVMLTVKVKIKTKGKNIDPNVVISDMDYNFTSQTEGATITDTEIVEQEVV
jgi:hypothetical protein